MDTECNILSSFSGVSESDSLDCISSSTSDLRSLNRINEKKSSDSNANQNEYHIPKFSLSHYIREDHKKPIYCVQFNPYYASGQSRVFASVGSNRATIYECKDSNKITPLSVFMDSNPEEVFYTCVWTYDTKLYHSLIAIAGLNACIHILDTSMAKPIRSLIGHGKAINELKIHPNKPDILFSCSKDHSIRAWSIEVGVCIILFAGPDGHRDEVLSVDIKQDGDMLISCGMDHSFKIWNLLDSRVQERINDSSPDESLCLNTSTFPTLSVYSPIYTTRDIHSNYIDCVHWLGNLILSKSCENVIVCWKPADSIFQHRYTDNTIQKANDCKSECDRVFRLYEYSVPKTTIWFIKFSIDPQYRLLAVGNQEGSVFIYSMRETKKCRTEKLNHIHCNYTVRHVTFSPDSKVLIVSCDDSTLWRWDQVGDKV